jgi:hypothetical protein
MAMLRAGARFLTALVAAVLPARLWPRLPASVQMRSAAFVSGIVTLMAGTAVGIPGFLAHAGANTSLANTAMVAEASRNPDGGYNRGFVQGFAGLSIFTFLLLTPAGWLTLYLVGSGGVRAGAAWFDDPVGDPILTAVDAALVGAGRRLRATRERAMRDAREGPAIPDRIVSAAAAGIPGCDLVIVASRRKEGWEAGVAVYTQAACYRIGAPVEQTIAGRLRTLYPLTMHADFEAIRRSVTSDLPPERSGHTLGADAYPRD